MDLTCDETLVNGCPGYRLMIDNYIIIGFITDDNYKEILVKAVNEYEGLREENENRVSEIKKLGKNEYLKNKLLHMSSEALTIKLLDRMTNVADYPTNEYIEDTLSLMDFISDNRLDKSDDQKSFIVEIKNICLQKHQYF